MRSPLAGIPGLTRDPWAPEPSIAKEHGSISVSLASARMQRRLFVTIQDLLPSSRLRAYPWPHA